MINTNVIKLTSSLAKLNNAYLNKKCRIIDEKVYDSNFLFYHYFYWSSDFYNNVYRSILVDFFNKAESKYPGSSYFVSDKFCKLVNGKTLKRSKTKTDKTFKSIMEYLSTITSKESFELFKSILEFSGADATITCEKTKNKDIEVEKLCLPVFDFKIEDSFKNIYFNNVEKTTKSFIISVVDGFIERESELYSLLEYAKKNNLPILLICRGISDYAKSNLKQIILKNNVHVYPYIEKYNHNDPFKLSDVDTMLDYLKNKN